MRTKRVLLQEDILEIILDSFMIFYLKQKKQDIPGMIISVDFEKLLILSRGSSLKK